MNLRHWDWEAPRPARVINALTVDVEDYFQVSAFEKGVRREDWGLFQSRVVQNTHRILDLLERLNLRATFFVLGWVADRYPELVRAIHGRGHEIGSHGYWHRLIYEQSPREFRADVGLSRRVLEDVIGQPVTAYRAPSFSITKASLWALDILVEEGFTIDSSIFPIHHDRYGIPDAQPGIHRIVRPAGDLWEWPPAVASVGGVNLPISGGGYFRLFPLGWTLEWLSRLNAKHQPFLFYFHPWELDPRQPRIRASWIAQARHRVNLASTERKLQVLLDRFCFGRLGDLIPRRQGTEDRAATLSCQDPAALRTC